MKKLIIIILMIMPFFVNGQTAYEKSISLDGADNIDTYFKWPDVITVKYHDKQEVLIKGTVSINYGQYDENFYINASKEGNSLKIESGVKDINEMEHITVVRSKDEDDGRQGSNYTIISGDESEYISKGVMMDIILTVYLPRSTPVKIGAKFGLIEIHEIQGPLIADSKFGGVDVTIDKEKNLDLKAGTVFGEIFTDINVDFRGNGELRKTGKWHRITSTFGRGGMPLDVESKFGNVYLRKDR